MGRLYSKEKISSSPEETNEWVEVKNVGKTTYIELLGA